MFDYVNEYLRRMKEAHKPDNVRRIVVPPVRCASGLELSIQASRLHHCTPKEGDGPWDAVEVGFPSRTLRTLLAYRDSTGDIYTRVPVEKLNRIIGKAGGIVHPITVLPPPKKH